MIKSKFPTLDKIEEKIKQHCLASDLYALIEKSISLLIAKTFDDYSNEEKNFLKEQLYKIITRIINYDHRPSLNDSILKLFLEVTNLTYSTKLNPYAIQSLTPFFDIDYHEPDIFKVTTEDLENVYDFKNSFINPEMIILKPEIPLFHEKLLKIFFDKSILDIILSMINSEEINVQQISSIMNFFTKIQYFLDERLSLSLCLFYSQYSLKILTNNQFGTEGVPTILIFFKTFMNHLVNLHPDIFHLATEILRCQNQNQYEALLLFISMIEDLEVAQNQKVVKNTLLILLQQTSNIQIIREVYQNFSNLAKKISFTEDDITNFVCYIRKIPNEANPTSIILNLIPAISNPYLKPVNNILLGLNLISCSDNEGISNLLLTHIIKNFDKKCNLTSNKFNITEKMASLITSSLNLNQGNLDLINLGYFLSNFPHHDAIHEYIMKITEEEDFEIYSPVLKRIALSSSRFESEKLLLSLAQSVIDQFIGRRFTPRISKLTEVVVNWITNFQSVPDSQIMTKLLYIDYYKCPDEIPAVVSAVMAKTKNRRLVRQLIKKIMKDTVPEKHANWAINMSFDAIHDERICIEKIAEILFQLLSENTKRSNVIHMIYQAVLYEADFFNIGKAYQNCGMKVEAILDGQPFDFTIHPLHSARRVYTEVGKFLTKRLSNFTLYIKGKEILPDQPLSAIPLKFDSKNKLNITVGENENRNDYCRLFLQPIFIEYIQQTERFTALFNLMNNFDTEGEILFLILNLIDNEMIKPVLSSPIQQIFRRDYYLSLVDLDSSRLFPFVLDAARGSKTVYSSSYLTTVFEKLNDQYLDKVSLLMACNLISSCAEEGCKFDTCLIRKFLITSNKKVIRKTMANILVKTNEKDKLLYLMSSTAQITNRNRTKQYFNLLKKKEIDPYLIEPLLKLIHQYETNFDGEIDQTINGIFEMDLQPTTETFELVFSFLFTPPTVRSKYLPFLHTLKSRRNAYDFILKYDDCINKINTILSMVPMSSDVRKLNDNLSYYKRGFLSPLNLNTSILILLHSIEAIRNYVITIKSQNPPLITLSNLFFEMSFTCLPSINISDYMLLMSDKNAYNYLKAINELISGNPENPSFYDLFHIKCHAEKIKFSEQWTKVVTDKNKSIIFLVIDNPKHNKFKFPLFFENYILRAAAIKSDDNDYSVIYRGREINDVTNLITNKDDYLFDIYNKSCWFIAGNNEISKFDISELPERCFGGKKKKQSAFLLAFENQDIEIPKIRVDKIRQEEIDEKNSQVWPSVVCNSHGFIDFARKLFEKDIDRYLEFGYDAFFKIAIIDDLSLKDWKDFLIEKVLIDERKSEIFIDNFVSNDTIIEKVDFSKSGAFILSELFSVAKKNFNIDFEKAFKFIQLFENLTSLNQFGFICDILSFLIVDSKLEFNQCRYVMHFLTTNLMKFDSVYKIYDRVLNCFNALMSNISNFLENSSNLLIDDMVKVDFLNKWIEIGKKSEQFKSILELIMKNYSEKCSEEASLVISQILDSSQLPNSLLPPNNSPILPNSPTLNLPKRIKTIKLIKRKNRPNNEFDDQTNTSELNNDLQNSETESIFDEFNDQNHQENKNDTNEFSESSSILESIHEEENKNKNEENENETENNQGENDQNENEYDENIENDQGENDHNEDEYDENNENDQSNQSESEYDANNENDHNENEYDENNENEYDESSENNENNQDENESNEKENSGNNEFQNIPSIFNINSQVDMNSIANAFSNPTKNINEGNNNNNEYSYSDNEEEEEEEEEVGENENNGNNSFIEITNNEGMNLNSNSTNSDFILISNSNSENNLNRNSNNNSNDNFIIINNSNGNIINTNETNFNNNKTNNQNNNNNENMSFDFELKSDSPTSDSPIE